MPNNVTQGVLFDNCLILTPNGEPTGRCEKSRVDWYLERGLAEKVADNPITIKLKFTPKGNRGMKDPWTLAAKPNHCVVCGVTENLNRHHVVPWSFLRHMPDSHKKHNSHDVLPTCVECHTRYEEESQKKRQYFSELYNIPLSGEQARVLYGTYISGLARTLVEHSEKIPPTRLIELKTKLLDGLGYEPSQEELMQLAKNKARGGIGFGKLVIDKVQNFDEFAIFWRQHFLDTMKPAYMPDYWRVDRKFDEDYSPNP